MAESKKGQQPFLTGEEELEQLRLQEWFDADWGGDKPKPPMKFENNIVWIWADGKWKKTGIKPKYPQKRSRNKRK